MDALTRASLDPELHAVFLVARAIPLTDGRLIGGGSYVILGRADAPKFAGYVLAAHPTFAAVAYDLRGVSG